MPLKRSFWALMLLGALVRVVVLPLPGTIDVQTQKLWSYGAATDVTGIYGVGGTPPERRLVHWLDLYGPVDYPPFAMLELAVVGRVYHAIDPAYADSTLLTILVKAPGLIAELLFVVALLTWGPRILDDAAARWAAVAFWLNPAVWFSGSALGYVDAQGAVPAALALLAAATGRAGVAGALMAVAAGTKPQTIYLLPIVAATVFRGGGGAGWRKLARAALWGLVATAAIVAPFVIRGAGDNMIQGVSRLLQHNMLSATAPNVGWILTWLLRVWHAVPDMGWAGALGLEIRILQISRVIELGYPDPRPIAAYLTFIVIAAASWRAIRSQSLTEIAALGALSIYAYSMIGIPVHENHFYPALPLFAVAAAGRVPMRAVYWITSAIFTLNLYLFYGLGRGWPPSIGRGWTYIDFSVLLAAVNVVVFVWAAIRIRRASAPAIVEES
jgi:hypothetical protein